MATTALLLSTMPALSLSMKSPLFLLSPSLNANRINTRRPHLKLQAIQETKEETKAPNSPERLTEKYGLEYGLWKIFFSSKEEKSKDEQGGKEEKPKTEQAKELLTKYGGAYLATSLFLSIISFSLCYFLVSAGIDVQSLLNKVGIVTDETGGKVGTFALAYAAHKAASPIRFPPTVALTPIVANWIGKKTQDTQG